MTVNKCDLCGKIYDENTADSVVIVKGEKPGKFRCILAKFPRPFSMSKKPITQDICPECWKKIEQYIADQSHE